MKTNFKSLTIALLAIIILTSANLVAQETTTKSKTTISVETDPSTFLFKGYAFHVRINPKNSKHLVLGAGAYALDLPAVMVSLNAENKDKGWNIRINNAVALFGEYYFAEANKKWFAGLQAGIQAYKNTNDNISNKTSKYSNLLIMPSVGYNWQPFKFPFYVKPWFGIGYTTKISGDNSIDNLTYDISPLVPFVTLHVGYTFNK